MACFSRLRPRGVKATRAVVLNRDARLPLMIAARQPFKPRGCRKQQPCGDCDQDGLR